MYFGNPTAGTRQAMLDGLLGYIDSPAQGNKRPPGVVWCADNGCFGDGWPGADAWFAWLARNAHDAASCVFAVAPDALCDHQRTYLRSDRWLEKVRDLGYPVAFVAQNGARPYSVPWPRLDVLFLGGDTEWKLGPAARQLTSEAKGLGKWVHMGRVNSEKRLRYATAIGCDSADGTYLTFGPDVNLPKVQAWLHRIQTRGVHWQDALFDLDAAG